MSTEKQCTKSLYPKLDGLIPYEDVSNQINKNLSDGRIKEIQTKRHELEMNLKHYKKILKRWKKIGNILKISSIIIVGGSAITSMVLGFDGLVTPLILGILSTIGASEGI